MRINVCNAATGHDLVLFSNPVGATACGTDGREYVWMQDDLYWIGHNGDRYFETSRSEPRCESPIPPGEIVVAVHHSGGYTRNTRVLAPDQHGTPWWPFDDPEIDTYMGTTDQLATLAAALTATAPPGLAGFYNRKLADTITAALR